MGQPVRDTRGRFRKVRTWLARFLVVFVVVGFGYAITADRWVTTQHDISSISPIVHAGETMEAKVERLKEDILDTLALCESGGRSEEDGIVVLDTNNVGSYGAYQFQRKTVMHYVKLMTGNEVNGRDAIILAMTPDKARELASWIIFETASGVEKDWYNCSKRNDLQVEVNIIKKLIR